MYTTNIIMYTHALYIYIYIYILYNINDYNSSVHVVKLLM